MPTFLWTFCSVFFIFLQPSFTHESKWKHGEGETIPCKWSTIMGLSNSTVVSIWKELSVKRVKGKLGGGRNNILDIQAVLRALLSSSLLSPPAPPPPPKGLNWNCVLSGTRNALSHRGYTYLPRSTISFGLPRLTSRFSAYGSGCHVGRARFSSWQLLWMSGNSTLQIYRFYGLFYGPYCTFLLLCNTRTFSFAWKWVLIKFETVFSIVVFVSKGMQFETCSKFWGGCIIHNE